MKKLFFLCVTLAATVVASAQIQVATLSSADNISTYYGVDALKTAYAAAADGDVITLSAGKFNVPDTTITKLITIRGAGMEKLMEGDSIVQLPTQLLGNISVKAKGTDANRFMLEGVFSEGWFYLGGSCPAFSKCKVMGVGYVSTDTVQQATFLHCNVYEKFISRGEISCYASYLHGFDDAKNGMSCNLTNCIVAATEPSRDLSNSCFTNCIIQNLTSNNGNIVSYSGNPMFFNCVWVGYVGSINDTQTGGLKNPPFTRAVNQNNRVWKPSNSTPFVADSFYELVEEAKQYKGTDGTEIGIHGGTLPFDPTPAVPQITKFSVAPKTDAEGKLSVDIEISEP